MGGSASPQHLGKGTGCERRSSVAAMEQLKLGRGVAAVGAMGTEPEVAFDPEKAFVSSREVSPSSPM